MTAMETNTPTETPSPTETRTLTPTPNPFAIPATIGEGQRIPRSIIVQPLAPAPGTISPLLFGLNYWKSPLPPSVERKAETLNLKIMRWGGENLEHEPFAWSDIDDFILFCRELDVEPLIQVPYDNKTPDRAAQFVRYVNIEKKYDVRYWAIGNEPDANRRFSSDEFNAGWRAFRDAMVAVDPRIIMVGPDLAHFDIDDSTSDWLRSFLRANGDVLGMVSLHHYSFNGRQTNPTVLIGDAYGRGKAAKQLRDLILNVTGRNIPLAITETNLSAAYDSVGEGSSASFSAGMWLAEALGEYAEAGVSMVDVWSTFRDGSISIIGDRAEDLRPTFWALDAYSDYTGAIVPLASHVQNVSAHASRSPRDGSVTIILVNRGHNPLTFKLEFSSAGNQAQGAIYFDLGVAKGIEWNQPEQSFAQIQLDSKMHVTSTMVYSRYMYDKGQRPYATGTE